MNWIEDIYGETNIGALDLSAKSGYQGTNYWGKNFFSSNKKENKSNLLKSCKQFTELITDKPHSIQYCVDGKDESFTDGKKIVITSTIRNFDSVIGASLHEAAHIAKTDFSILEMLFNEKQLANSFLSPIQRKNVKVIKDILNVVEDRWIDNWVYTESIGFRVYYKELYKRYFLSSLINSFIKKGYIFDKKSGVKHSLKEETLNNYMFFLINIINKNVKLDTLKGLQEIWDILDVENIKRIKSTSESLLISLKIFDVIFKYVKEEEKQSSGKGDKSNNDLTDLAKMFDLDPDNGNGEDGQVSDILEEKEYKGKKSKKEFNKDIDLDEFLKGIENGDLDSFDSIGGEILKKVSEEISKQDKFTKDRIKNNNEKDFSDLLGDNIDILEVGDIDNEEENNSVGRSYYSSGYNKPYVVKYFNKVTNEDILSKKIPNISIEKYEKQSKYVDEGIRLGYGLAKRLKVKNEVFETIFSRERSGKIDKRILASAGYGSNELFYRKVISTNQDIFIHMSLDVSGSMGGNPWHNVLKTCSAIATAANLIDGIRCQISYRSDNIFSNDITAVLFYDSLYDKKSKIKNLAYIIPSGSTPEGLIYDKLIDTCLKGNINDRGLFVNFTDGMPGSGIMGEQECMDITRKSILKMKSMKMHVLSFLIGNGKDISDKGQSVYMYGKESAKFINTNEIIILAKTINDILLKLGRKQYEAF